MSNVAKTHSFIDILHSFTPDLPEHLRCVMGIDPGETTGLAVFENGELIATDQIDHRGHKDLGQAASEIEEYIILHKPTHIAMEDYRVYGTHAKSHTNSDLFTPRLIGALEMVIRNHGIGVDKQMASYAKRFMTDAKLRAWGFWIKGKRHSRDAVRHAGTYMLAEAQKIKREKKND